jgi:hypothetical protein
MKGEIGTIFRSADSALCAPCYSDTCKYEVGARAKLKRA